VGDRLKRRAHRLDVLRRLVDARHQRDEAVTQALVSNHEAPGSVYAERTAELEQSIADMKRMKVSLLEESLMVARRVDRMLLAGARRSKVSA
jgi:CRISPR/Cas system Type II protein with McrA/HNH and RuvC-like nuclease domain